MTDSVEIQNKRNKFLLSIIKSIQIEMDDFMARVANKDCYESLIYKWAIRLFEKDTTTDYAINVIHRALRQVLISKTYYPNKKETSLTLEKLFVMINDHPKYNKLDQEAKNVVQKKIAEMFNNSTRIEIIEEVLEQINPNVTVDKEKNQVAFIRSTINRIMNTIRKWNLREYWKNKSERK